MNCAFPDKLGLTKMAMSLTVVYFINSLYSTAKVLDSIYYVFLSCF